MLTIGDFARHGQVSVRMLRHYDAIGLLRPAHVDASSNYRYYQAAQLSRLNRIIALKELGFTLNQVESLLAEDVDVAELRGMLRLRRVELAAAMADAAARLAQVEARLRIIESEGTMPTDDIVVKTLPAVRLAELTAIAEDFEPQYVGPAISPLYPALCGRLAEAGVPIVGPGLAYYEDGPESGSIRVHAAMPVGPDAAGDVGGGVAIVDLPQVERAATIVHHGSMDNVMATGQTLARWVEASGFQPVGYVRELYLDCPEDKDKWVTELQQPLS
ncbi:MAG TPA: MerR family transcriptional regulator [Actinocrinis sp.]|nr:MerR family transcriptional regulator [Actinocrinis sp.]